LTLKRQLVQQQIAATVQDEIDLRRPTLTIDLRERSVSTPWRLVHAEVVT